MGVLTYILEQPYRIAVLTLLGATATGVGFIVYWLTH